MLITKLPKESRDIRKQSAGEASYSVTMLNGEKYFKSRPMAHLIGK